MTGRRGKLLRNLVLGLGVLAGVLVARGYFVFFDSVYSFAHDGVCVTSPPGYHIGEDRDGDAVVWIVTRFTGQSALIGDERSFHHHHHYHALVRLDGREDGVDVHAQSEAELKTVSAMIRACSTAIPPPHVRSPPKAA